MGADVCLYCHLKVMYFTLCLLKRTAKKNCFNIKHVFWIMHAYQEAIQL